MTEKKLVESETDSRSARFEAECGLFLDVKRNDRGFYRSRETERAFDVWRHAERDTRERIAQLAVDAIKETMRDHFPSRMFTSEIELVCVRVAERIREVNR